MAMDDKISSKYSVKNLLNCCPANGILPKNKLARKALWDMATSDADWNLATIEFAFPVCFNVRVLGPIKAFQILISLNKYKNEILHFSPESHSDERMNSSECPEVSRHACSSDLGL